MKLFQDGMDIKKVIYILLWIVLGILLSTILHAVIEIPIINLLVSDFQRYSLGLSWDQWYLIHYIGTIILLILGIVFGLFCGFKFWHKIYEKNKK
jgi:hypothetical protein